MTWVLGLDMTGQSGLGCPYLVAACAAELVEDSFVTYSQMAFGFFEFRVDVGHGK